MHRFFGGVFLHSPSTPCSSAHAGLIFVPVCQKSLICTRIDHLCLAFCLVFCRNFLAFFSDFPRKKCPKNLCGRPRTRGREHRPGQERKKGGCGRFRGRNVGGSAWGCLRKRIYAVRPFFPSWGRAKLRQRASSFSLRAFFVSSFVRR